MTDKKYGIDGVGTAGSYKLDKTDMNMSIDHLKDTLEYNLRHSEEHLRKAKAVCERLCKVGEPHHVPKSLVDLLEYFDEVANRKDSSEMSIKKITKSKILDKEQR